MASSSNSSSETYEVFLSFRGDDTRKGFTGHLYKALQDRGVHAFMDDGGLEVGENIGDNLWKAIEGSSLCIPILSPGYATSRWCLMEVTKMVECNKTIIPVFYDVDPSDVRKQRGPFKAPFQEHERNFHDRNQVVEWRKSLAHVGELKGLHLRNDADGYESHLILLIVKEVLDRFHNVPLHLSEHLFGIDSRVEVMMKLLSIEDNDVRMIGMVGMGGIGKTTLSKVVYNKISKGYEASSFLSDVRERSKGASGLTSLQQTLLSHVKINDVDQGKTQIIRRFSHKKVLIVLDDVDDKDQLEALAGQCNWFGRGSRIVITTRDEHVLNVHGLSTDQIYRLPDGLNNDDSLRLFSYHAFRKSAPEEGYMELSRRIVSATGGLPLALEVFGSFLFDKRDLVEWEEQLKVLKGKTNIQEKLRISYDGLSEDEKMIFLDIACFFKRDDKNSAISLWEGCGLAANSAIHILLLRSLIKIDKDANGVDVFRMHDLVRDMGRGIAYQNNTVQIAEGAFECIWWNLQIVEGAFEYISRNPKGSTLVEGIDLRVDSSSRIQHVPISLLRVSGTIDVKESKFKHMREGLRWLEWKRSFMRYLPNDFNLEKIVVLQLVECYLTRLWKKDRLFRSRKVFHHLKVLNLRRCYRLEVTPDFSACPNLEWLALDDCGSLVELDESVGTLHWLRHLSLEHCDNLEKLPSSVWDLPRLEELHMFGCESVEFSDAQRRPPVLRGGGGGGGASLEKKLRVLNLRSCRKLTRLPDAIGGGTKDLIRLDLSGTSIGYLHHSIGNCTRLVELNVSFSPLRQLPASIGNLTNLTQLDISNTPLKEVPDSMGRLANLTRLDISRTSLKELPATMGRLTNLTRLDISHTRLKELPDDIGNLTRLTVLDISSNRTIKEIPGSIGNLTNLTQLHISQTPLKELPDSFGNLTNLTQLHISRTPLKELPASVGNLTNLTWFRISETPLKELSASFGNLTNLTQLDISGASLEELPASIGNLTNLIGLRISETPLKELPASFGNLTNLTQLDISGTSLEELPASIGNLTNLIHLRMRYIITLLELPDSIGNLTNLTDLDISGNETVEELPDSIQHLQKLKFLEIRECHELESLSWEKLKSLRELKVEGRGEERFKDDDFYRVSPVPFTSMTGHLRESPIHKTDYPFRRLQLKREGQIASDWELVLSSSGPVGLDGNTMDARVVAVNALHDWGCAYTGMQWLRFIFPRDFVVDKVILAGTRTFDDDNDESNMDG